MKKTQTTKGVSTGKVIAIGAGVVAAAALSYYFFGPEGKKNQKKLKGWMVKMKGEVLEKIESAKEMSEHAYHTIVDTVASQYAKSDSVAEVKAFAENLKKQWKGIAKTATAKKTVKKVMKKVAPKKVVKKVAKKVTSKKK
jgi:hypothetical protein